jgi:hypothetical protein
MSCAPTESYVEVPVTLEEAKALHAPPEVVVSVARQKATPGGAPCHSPVCIIILPFVLYEAFFPEEWDQVTVTKAGKRTLTGRYSTGGDLIEASLLEDGVERSIAPIPLRELGKNVIVEVARTPIDAEGSPTGEPVRSKLLPQVDLTAMYRSRLGEVEGEEDRGYLIAEYGAWLGDESLPFLRDVVPGEPDTSASMVVDGLCLGSNGTWRHPATTPWKTGQGVLLDYVQKHRGFKTAVSAFKCAAGIQDAELTVRTGQALVQRTCDQADIEAVKTGVAALGDPTAFARLQSRDAVAWSPEETASVRSRITEKVAACRAPDRRVYLQAALGLPLDEGELLRALSKSPLAFDIARRLRVGTPGEREAIYRMLGESAAQPPLVDALAAGRFVQTEGEYEALAGVYGQRLGGALDAEVRADLLDLFDLAEGRPELVAGARAKLWARVPAVTPEQRPLVQVALAVLGEVDQELPASRGLERMFIGPLDERRNTVFYGLKLAGCDRQVIIEASKTAASVRPDARGRLCPE